MGCLLSKKIKQPPEEQTREFKQKLKEIRNLWVPGSIWTGTISINGIESAWEIHVERDSTPERITGKRLVNFALLTFVEASRVDFDLMWVEHRDENGKKNGFDGVITFEWLDADYRLFTDTMNGIINIPERRIKGLVVESKSNNKGTFEFFRVLANESHTETSLVRAPSVQFLEQSDHSNRIIHALETANTKVDQDTRRLTCTAEDSMLIRKTYGNI